MQEFSIVEFILKHGFGLLAFGLFFYEILIWGPRHQVDVGTWRQSFRNFLFLISAILFLGMTGFPMVRLMNYFSKYRIVTFPHSIFFWVFTALAVDFIYYCFHRLAHQNEFFWSFHSTHHLDTELNVTTGWRGNLIYYVFLKLLFFPLCFLGVEPEDFTLSFWYLGVYQPWLHSRSVGKIPFFEGIITTPTAHRLHHASNELYHGKNLGGVLIIWDRLLGTYIEETEKPHYVFPAELADNVLNGHYRAPLKYIKSKLKGLPSRKSKGPVPYL